jgi:catechol 2,3-dioxygenase-like lactoylglutathione lyase family enzyme
MRLTRRDAMGLLCAAGAVLPAVSIAQSPALLPINTPGLDHLDVMVPDAEKSARFYMGLFRTTLYAQEFRGGQRYFLLLSRLPGDRAVGYVAIGASQGRGAYIGHFCTSVVEWRRDSEAIFAAMTEQLRAGGFGEFKPSGSFGGLFDDPDGIEIQFLPSPDTLVTVAQPSQLVPWQQGMVTPLRVDSMLARVSDLDRAVAYYRVIYGPERRRDARSAEFAFRNGSRLVLEASEYQYGRSGTGLLRYGVRVQPFDRAAVEAGIASLGGTVVAGGEGGALRLRDVDGIELELVPA